MNRRDFMKMAALGFAGVMFPNTITERTKKMIGEILEKMAMRMPLSLTEIQQLKIWGNQSELNNQYITTLQDGTANIYAQKVYAQSFESPYPFNGYSIRVNMDAVVSATSGVLSTVTWGKVYYDDFGAWNGVGSTTISLKKRGNYLIEAYVNWDGAAGGYRKFSINGTAAVDLYASPGSSLVDCFYRCEKVFGVGDISLSVLQNSGGAVNYNIVDLKLTLIGEA